MTLDTDLDGHRHEVTTLRITGMTCAACERRVTRALAGLPGVDSVTASATRVRATLNGTPPSDDAVRAALEAAGYRLGAPPWITREKQPWTTAAVSAVAVAALEWLALRLGVHGPATDDGSGRDLAGGVALALLVGLAAGVSTCMALVGGLVLGISASQAERHAQDRTSGGPGRLALIRPHLVFTAGRLAGFALGGALLGVVGSAARLPGPVVAGAGVAAAAVMALLGVRLTGLSPRMSGWALSLPGRWGDRVGTALGRSSGVGVVGAATFLLPAGSPRPCRSTRSPSAARGRRRRR